MKKINMQKRIDYIARDFASIRSQLIEYTKKHFPDTYTDFNDASIGMLLIELNAAVGDMLSFNTDRAVQETMLDFAQEKRSLLALARTYGLKIPFKRPSVTIVDFSVDVPVKGDTFDLSYCPLIVRGASVIGAGQNFETLYDIDFSSPFTSGIANRTIVPNIDGTGKIVNYTITKREIVVAGRTKYYKRIVTPSDVKPFFSVDLPDGDVLSVENIVQLNGTEYNRLPTIAEQTDPDNIWYAVDSLAQNKIFLEYPLTDTDSEGIVVGKWTNISRRFMYEYSDRGFVTVIFGNGVQDTSVFNNYLSDSDELLNRVGDMSNNGSLGDIPASNTTLFIKYRVGGGLKSNVGVNVINSLGNGVNMFVGGINATMNQKVRSSLRVNNPIPALGGQDLPSLEDIRNTIKYNFTSQNRCVTIKDYYAQIAKMGGQFGSPYKYSVANLFNKVVISIMGQNADGTLSNVSTNTLKDNISNYLSEYKQINDYILIQDGQIVNIGFEFDLLIDRSYNPNEIASQVIDSVYSYIQDMNLIMGQDVYLTPIYSILGDIGGVLSVAGMRVYNKVGGGLYSLNESVQNYVAGTKTTDVSRQIELSTSGLLLADYNQILEIKYKDKDIRVRFATA